MKKKTIAATCLAATMSLFASAHDVIDFCGGWTFKKAPSTTETMQAAAAWNGRWDSVSVPHTWNATDMLTRVNNFYAGAAYYRKHFSVPSSWKDKVLYLRFEGVASCAEVYINGKLVATHKGGYSAFACNISKDVRHGQSNEIVVKADNSARPDVIPVNHNLFGIYGGMYRPVSLIVAEPCHIAVTDCAGPGVYVRQQQVSSKGATVCVTTKTRNATRQPAPATIETTITDDKGNCVARVRKKLTLSPQGIQAHEATMQLSKPHLWQGREDPYLYKVTVRILQNGKVTDKSVQPLGLRNIEIKPGKGVWLNGKRYPMYGVTRHQDRWGKGSALSKADHDEDLAMIMDVGATTIRLAHYQQSDYFYSRCDSLGLLVWAEIPFVNRVTGQEWDNAHTQLRELIRQSYNHPSIYIWGLHNEVYTPHAYTADLTSSLHELAKQEDPDRLTASVNGYGHADHPVNMNADIQGMNRYFGWYERKIKDINGWVEGLEKNYPSMPLMLTEYGADGNIRQQTEYLGESLNWGDPFYPETFETKVHEYQWSVIAKHPYILASYLWNMFDFGCPMWERGGVPARNMKGLVTIDRKVKKDAYYWYKANWSKSPVLYLTQRRNTDRERRVTSITVYSNVGQPKVFLNGQELEGIHKGFTDVHYVIDNVTLKDGENIVTTTATDKQGNKLSDEIRWQYTGEKRRSARQGNNNAEHAGF